MNIKIYKNSSANNTVDKSLSGEKLITNCKPYGDISVLNPVFILDSIGLSTVAEYNYCYIEDLKRYYYCTFSVEKHMTIMSCTVDPLKTYKDSIKGMTCYIARSETDGNSKLADNNYPVETDVQYEVKLGKQILHNGTTYVLGVI